MSKIIDIIQGTSISYMLDIGSPENKELISSIVFCSKRLGIHKEIPWIEQLGGYVLSFTAEETRDFPACRADYSISIHFIDRSVEMPTYRGDMFIRENDCDYCRR